MWPMPSSCAKFPDDASGVELTFATSDGELAAKIPNAKPSQSLTAPEYYVRLLLSSDESVCRFRGILLPKEWFCEPGLLTACAEKSAARAVGGHVRKRRAGFPWRPARTLRSNS